MKTLGGRRNKAPRALGREGTHWSDSSGRGHERSPLPSYTGRARGPLRREDCIGEEADSPDPVPGPRQLAPAARPAGLRLDSAIQGKAWMRENKEPLEDIAVISLSARLGELRDPSHSDLKLLTPEDTPNSKSVLRGYWSTLGRQKLGKAFGRAQPPHPGPGSKILM
ncbi:PREDICTED: uncharacterized protein LOC102019560 isoform X3 [Chinchilla lanigera]|uniref:uncharacterized protein LOC102019560 isoform X3 n=1 Tax=Chinchilla lanigera TaxID=34839 RepID=UPI00069668D2|nr:PREDICTED: uncharacterized protein LOC102019560 isoform X3 [Chinchilla lanigera]XP_013369843.1 PREDICTED: uncharacterized protein LOC102019560 isoform X3 [Chinchilla lanigera]